MKASYLLIMITAIKIVHMAATLGIPKGSSCYTNGELGICKLVTESQYARDLRKAGKLRGATHCGFEGNIAVICEPVEELAEAASEKQQVQRALDLTEKVIPIKRKSEQYCDIIKPKRPSLINQIMGGTRTVPGELPFMAAVGFTRRGVTNIDWNCGATLISRNFALTAAHCIQTGIKWLRFGVIDKTKSNPAQPDITIKNFHKHANYRSTSKYDDIALLELERPVTLDLNVNPICLPLVGAKSQDDKYTIAGWGYQDEKNSTDFLLKAEVDEFDHATCQNNFNSHIGSSHLNKGIIESQICAHNSETKTDTCQGDSGGPIFYREREIYYIYGVTSFGLVKTCSEDAAVPGIYTKVEKYLDWIEGIVWPNDVLL